MREMERGIIGSMLADSAVAWDLVDRLRPEMFQDEQCRMIYAACRDLLMSGAPLAINLISARLPDLDNATAILAVLLDGAEAGVVHDFVDEVTSRYKRRCAVTIADELQRAMASDTVDVDQIAADYQAKLSDLTVTSGDGISSLDDILASVIEKGKAAMETEFRPGMDTGLFSLDEILGLIMPGDLGAICGGPGDGKTSLAMQIALHVSKWRHVVVFEMEMPGDGLGRRILAGESGSSVQEISSGELDYLVLEKMLKAREDLKKRHLDIIDRPMSMSQIRTKCIALKKKRGLDLIVIDYLGLVKGSSPKLNKFERADEVCEQGKSLAKELNCAVIVLCQRTQESRRRDDPTPRLTDLEGGGALEKFGDWAVAIFRRDEWIKQTHLSGDIRKWRTDPEEKDPGGWYKKFSDCEGKAELCLLKRRSGPSSQKRIVRFDGRASKFLPLNGD